MFIELLILVLVILLCFYKWSTANYDYFKKRNIPFVKPFPLLGSYKGFFLKTESWHDEFIRRHNEHKNAKIYGAFGMRQPVHVINDLELLKNMTIKDFDHFTNHFHFTPVEVDAFFGNALFSMDNEMWKDMRTTLTPAFTGSKMRLMFQLVTEICDEAVDYLKEVGQSKLTGFDIEMKDFFTLFANDAISSTAFGLKIDSLSTANKDNEFYRMAKKATNFTTKEFLKFSFYNTCGFIFKIFNIKMGDKEARKYFYNLVIDAMKYREENNIIRPDMINILMEARKSPEKSHNREWTDIELVAQCFIFLFAGFESVSTTLCFAAQEFIENPDVQEKLMEEIDEVREELDGKPLTYEILQNMKYMDMVVSEVLRKWPPFIQTDRVCNKSYTFKSNNFSLDVNKGDLMWIPIVGLHYDPEYFPNPKKFDPERFSDENKGNIRPFSYAPFGLGPRLCLASRLALMEVKAILFYMLSNFTLEASEKSIIPIQLAPTNFPITAKNGFWLKMIPRN